MPAMAHSQMAMPVSQNAATRDQFFALWDIVRSIVKFSLTMCARPARLRVIHLTLAMVFRARGMDRSPDYARSFCAVTTKATTARPTV